uniref:Uncharacterized protein n=1 Tax=Setaria italica TaxID=4555 RepID=K3XU87_SETIT
MITLLFITNFPVCADWREGQSIFGRHDYVTAQLEGPFFHNMLLLFNIIFMKLVS